jgi:hypothetical protein
MGKEDITALQLRKVERGDSSARYFEFQGLQDCIDMRLSDATASEVLGIR